MPARRVWPIADTPGLGSRNIHLQQPGARFRTRLLERHRGNGDHKRPERVFLSRWRHPRGEQMKRSGVHVWVLAVASAWTTLSCAAKRLDFGVPPGDPWPEPPLLPDGGIDESKPS